MECSNPVAQTSSSPEQEHGKSKRRTEAFPKPNHKDTDSFISYGVSFESTYINK